MPRESVSEIEIMAYVDGELDLGTRLQMEDRFSRDPRLAARVMGELKAHTALKLLPLLPQASPEGERRFADRVRGRPRQARLAWVGFGAAAMSVLVMSFIWTTSSASPPSYVLDAIASHRTAMLRAAMVSQLEAPHFDAAEIYRETQIAMPELPGDWQVTDVQLFPSKGRSALIIAVKTSTGEPLSIFAIRKQSAAPVRPEAIRQGLESVAFWRRGNISYALTGVEDPRAIDASAETLTQLWKS